MYEYLAIILMSFLFLSVGGLEYERYYGKSLLNFLNSPWRIDEGSSPITLVFNGLENKLDSNETCHVDLMLFQASLRNSDEWAVRMADSSGGFLPGSLSGNLINLGSFDECLTPGTGGLPGKYCWLQIYLKGGVHQNSSFIPHNVPIRHSLCVPQTCSPVHVQELVGGLAAPNTSVAVTCQEAFPFWGPWEIFGAVFFSALFLTIIVSTFYDKFIVGDYEGYNGLWCSFSLKRNLKTLTFTQPNKFSSIDGLRVMSQCVVIIYHVWRDDLKNGVPVYNKFALNKFIRTWEGTLIVTSSFAVDTFTVIGGFLVMYSILSKDGKKIDMTQHLLNRFLRMYPPYTVGLILMLTLAGMMCDGPLCASVIYKRQTTCKEVWWTNVLCIHNIYPGLTKSCMSHTWYVATDLQLFMFLTPLIIIGLRESKRATIWTIVGVTCSSVILIFTLTVAKELKTENLLFDRAADEKVYYDTLYTEPYSRLGPWGIGLLFGVFMDNQKKNKLTLRKEHIIIMWVLCVTALVSMPLANVPFQQEGYEYSSVEAGLYNSISRPIWSLGICWIIFACSAGCAGLVNDFLSWRLFQLLGKLSYCAYLIHKIVINLYFSGLRSPIYISPFQQVSLMLGLILQSFLASFIFYLIAEVPFVHIAKFIFQKEHQRTRPEPTENVDVRESTYSRPSAFEASELGSTHLSQFYPEQNQNLNFHDSPK